MLEGEKRDEAKGEFEDYPEYGGEFGPPPPPPPSPVPTIVHDDKSTQVFQDLPKCVDKRNKIVEDGFGLLRGPDETSQIIRRYTLKNANGFRVQVINYGAIVTSIKCPDKVGRIHDVLLGFDNIQGYMQYQKAYHGAIIGRVANRIREGRFYICRQDYELSKNLKNECHLHGGFKGFDQALWDTYVDKENERVVMTYISKDGEEGYPGDVMTTVAYSISEDYELKIEMKAISNKPTPINLTSHMYFNLGGHCAGPKVLKDHFLTVNADKYLVTREDMIPTGDIRNVGGTIYDLRTPRQLGQMFPLIPGGGYDTTFCINGKLLDGIKLNARLRHPASGRVLEVFSDQPSLQVYTANLLPNPKKAPQPTSFSYIEKRPLGAAHIVKTSKVAKTSELKQSIKDAVTPVIEDILDAKPSERTGSSMISGKNKSSKILSPTGSMEISPVTLRATKTSAVPPTTPEAIACQEEIPPSETGSETSSSSSEDLDKKSSSSSECSYITPSEGSDGPLGPEQQEEEEPQLFTEMRAKDGVLYHRHGAICLETQNYPDAINHRRFPHCILRPGEMYSHTCIYRFSIQERQYV